MGIRIWERDTEREGCVAQFNPLQLAHPPVQAHHEYPLSSYRSHSLAITLAIQDGITAVCESSTAAQFEARANIEAGSESDLDSDCEPASATRIRKQNANEVLNEN